MKYALFEFEDVSRAQRQITEYSRIGWTVHTLRKDEYNGKILLLSERKESLT